MKAASYSTNKNKGFTLIEVLVVTGITVILLLGATSFFITFLISQARTTQKQQLKNAGEGILKQITQTLREARNVDPCTTGMNSINFFTINNRQAGYSFVTNQIVFSTEDGSSTISPEDMTVTSFVTNCYQTPQNSQMLQVIVTLENPKIQGPSGEALSQEFSTSVQLRN